MSSINPIGPTAAQTSAAARQTGTASLSDPNTFLQLLVSELKYQNPMNPADPNQYLAQTAQFAMVQKINDLDTQMTAMLQASEQSAAAALIGRQVVANSASGTPVTGVVTGMQMAGGVASLVIGTQIVPMANVTSVTNPTSAPAAAPTTAATSAPPTLPTPTPPA
jgi:flagellar basal-body rod modification protein FlgD